MKFYIFSILIAQIFTLHATIKNSETTIHSIPTNSSPTLRTVYSQPVWYYYWTPVYYYYSPSYPLFWDYYDYWYDPYFIWFRKDGDKKMLEKDDKPVNANEAKKELTQLRVNIWGKEDYSTDELRKDKKIYDPKWLIAQLKIARVLFLEDVIQNSQEKKSTNSNSAQSDKKLNANASDSSQPFLYYTWTPVAYSDDSNNRYHLSYHDYWYDSYLWWFNKDSNPESEIRQLKKNIWGNKDYSTANLRKEKKVFEPKWLIAQLKIARVALLEDAIKNS